MAHEAINSVAFCEIELNTVELPPTVEIRESSIINGVPGAFSKTIIHKDTRFGPYKGEIINAGQKSYIDYRFAWEVFEKNSNVLKYTISAMDSKSSNWMRHVNCARFFEEQNIISVQDGYSIFYVAMKDINPGEELLTWFDPKLLRRTKRRLSKIERKPVGYTIELVPWSDEKKFVPEIIETKRPRKKKILSDMICLDEDPLAITRMLQRLPKIPCNSKQFPQSSSKRASISRLRNISLQASSADAHLVSSTRKGSKSNNPGIDKAPRFIEEKKNDHSNTENDKLATCHDSNEEKNKLKNDESSCTDFKTLAVKAEKENGSILCFKDIGKNSTGVKKYRVRQKIISLKKIPVRLGKAKLQKNDGEIFHEDLETVKPIIIKHTDDGSTLVEDHDEMYILKNVDLRSECDDLCPCLDHERSVRLHHISDKEKQNNFVIKFTLLPEHKSFSPDNKIIFRCDVCNSAYNHAFSLKRHYLGVHINHRYLSKDDIVNYQIETFHTGIELHKSNPEIKIQTQSVVKNETPSHMREQQFMPAASVSDSDEIKQEIFHICAEKSPAQTKIERCKDLKCKESPLHVSDESGMNNGVQKFSAVSSLRSLAQISVDKAKSSLLLCSSFFPAKHLATYEETKSTLKTTNDSFVLKYDKSLDSNMPCLLESNCDYPAKTIRELESADFCAVDADKFVEGESKNCSMHEHCAEKPSSGLNEHTDFQKATVLSNIIKECNQHSILNVENVSQNSATSDAVLCCSDENLEKSQCDISHQDLCITSDSNHNLKADKIEEITTSRICEVQILPVISEKGIVAKTRRDSSCCTTKFTEQNVMSNNLLKNSGTKNIKNKDSNCTSTSRQERDATYLHEESGLQADGGESMKKAQGVSTSAFSMPTSTFSNLADMDRGGNKLINDHTVERETHELMCPFSESVKCINTENFVTSSKVTSVSNHLHMFPCVPVPTTAKLSEEFPHTNNEDPVVTDFFADVHTNDSCATHQSSSTVNDIIASDPCKDLEVIQESSKKAEMEKQEKSDFCTSFPDQFTLCHHNSLSIPVPEICTSNITATAESTRTTVHQSQPCQQLVFVTNIVFPVVSPSHRQLPNSLSLQSSISHVSSEVANQTAMTGHTASVPVVLISQISHNPSLQNVPRTTMHSSTDTIKKSVIGKTATELESSLSSGIKSPNSVCGNTTVENQCSHSIVTSTTFNTTLTSLSSRGCFPPTSEYVLSQPVEHTFKQSSPLTAVPSLAYDPHLPSCNIVSTQNPTSSKTSTSSALNLFPQKRGHTLSDDQPDDLYRCHMCVLLFKTMTELKLHIKNDPHRFKGGIKQYACQQCSMRFSNKNNLLRHNLMNHPENENYPFRCFTCGKGFVSETYLKMHARFHLGKNFPCKYGCVDVYFPNAASLVKHLRTQHAGLNLKEYLRNAKSGKAHNKNLKCMFDVIDGQITSQIVKGTAYETAETVVNSLASDSVNQPDAGFQARRGRPKGSKNTHKIISKAFPKVEVKMFMQDMQEPPINDERKLKLRFKCKLCLMGFSSHIKLLKHKTQKHGADQSVQEYLYQMSKETGDQDVLDSELGKLEFSPPPSPKTFFENVNRKGFENMKHYIDGSSESLQSWHKCRFLKSSLSVNEPILTSEKLEWTMFNFPPCFQYREDCTKFYDNSSKSNGFLPNDLTQDGKEKDKGYDVSNVKLESFLDSVKISQNIHEKSVEDEESILLFGNRITSVKENSSSASGCNGNQCNTNRLQYSEEIELKRSDKEESMIDRQHNTEPVKNKMTFSDDIISENAWKPDSHCPNYHIRVEDNTRSDGDICVKNVCNERKRENQSLLIQKETCSSGDKMRECNLQSLFDKSGVKRIYKYEAINETEKTPIDPLVYPDVADGHDIKHEISSVKLVQRETSTSCESYLAADVTDLIFSKLCLKEKFQVLKSRNIQGLNLEMSQLNHLKADRIMSQRSAFLIDALDLHIVGSDHSSKKLQQTMTNNVMLHATGLMNFKQKNLCLESFVTVSPNKQCYNHSHETPHINCDPLKHEHKRYSLWAGQVSQKFDHDGRNNIFCQPVTETLRRQRAMQVQLEYKAEKSFRDKEIYVKQHNKFAQKISFAESLELMTRKEFGLSYHAQKEKECIIKIPDVWENYENIWFGKRGIIAVVCSICHRHFSCWDLCLRHQLKKHPHIEPASLEMEKDNYIEDMYYYYPMPYGILAQTHLIPDNLPAPEVYVCTRCGFPFKNLSRLHAHIIVCDPAQEVINLSQNDNLKKQTCIKKKLLPMMIRQLGQNWEEAKMRSNRPVKKISPTAFQDEHKKLCFPNSNNLRSLTLNGKPSHSIQSRPVFTTPFSFYSGKKRKNYELFYNPQNHTRRRELYKVLDQHQCHGCNLKFKSLSMLERHVKKCSGKDKLQSQKPLLSGIMSGDTTLRKQHTCRYCNKRFTYIKGVDLHYKRICAVRKVKEEENQLTEEDLAHESELRKIIEHLKWSKSLNKDSSDIIQGHIKVEEDGSLTYVGKKRGWPKGLKKKLKKKCFKWTALKKHRTDVMSCASSASGTHESPFASLDHTSFVTEKVGKAVNALEQKRSKRNSDFQIFKDSCGKLHKRCIPFNGNPAETKVKVSEYSLTSIYAKNNKSTQNLADGHIYSKRNRLVKCAVDESKDYSGNHQNRFHADIIKNTKPKVSKTLLETSNSAVIANLDIKPPSRKRGRPKRFDPSDMESSYKKKKKCDHTKAVKTKNGRKGANCAISLRDTNQKQQRTQTVKGSFGSHMLREKSAKDLLETSASSNTEMGVFAHKTVLTGKEEAYSKEGQTVELNKLFAKMKHLKEAAKLETSKSSRLKKTSASLGRASRFGVVNCNYHGKKTSFGDKKDKIYLKPAINTSSSELFKHLTEDEEVLHRGNYIPQKHSLKRKRVTTNLIHPAEPTTFENIQVPVKRFKKSTVSATTSVPSRFRECATILSGLSTVIKTPLVKTTLKSENDKINDNFTNTRSSCSAETTPVLSSIVITEGSGVVNNNSFEKRSMPLKSTTSVHKQPIMSVRVVTLSPNGNNLLTYDSSSNFPSQASSLLTKSAPIAVNHSQSPDNILNASPQENVQLTKSAIYIHSPRPNTTFAEHRTKLPIIKRLAATSSEISDVIHSADAKAVNRLSEEKNNMNLKKSIAQSYKQKHVCQEGLSYPVSVDENLQKKDIKSNINHKCEAKQIICASGDTEKQALGDLFHGCKDEKVVKKIVQKDLKKESSVDSMKSSGDQIIMSSVGKLQVDSTDQLTPKMSVKQAIRHMSEKKATLLCSVSHVLKKQVCEKAKTDQTESARHSATSNISHLFSGAYPHSHFKITRVVTNKNKPNNVQQVIRHVHSVSPSKSTKTNICQKQTDNRSTCSMTEAYSLGGKVNEKMKQTVAAVIAPSNLTKTQITAPKKASDSTVTKLTTIPARFESPVKLITLRSTAVPTLVQGSVVQAGCRTTHQQGKTTDTTSCMTPTYSQTVINAEHKQKPTSHIFPAVVTRMPLHVNTDQLPRHPATKARHCESSQQRVLKDTQAQSLVNFSSDDANFATTTFNRKQTASSLSKQDYISEPLVDNTVLVAASQTFSFSSAESLSSINNMKTCKTAGKSLETTCSDTPMMNELMLSLDDGAAAIIDSDSLAQFLSLSPSYSESNFQSVTSLPRIVSDQSNSDVTQISLNQQNGDEVINI